MSTERLHESGVTARCPLICNSWNSPSISKGPSRQVRTQYRTQVGEGEGEGEGEYLCIYIYIYIYICIIMRYICIYYYIFLLLLVIIIYCYSWAGPGPSIARAQEGINREWPIANREQPIAHIYIHINPPDLGPHQEISFQQLEESSYSSYSNYLGHYGFIS